MVNISETHGLLWRDLGDERCALGMLLVCITWIWRIRDVLGHAFGVLGGPCESLGGPLGAFGCLLGGPWASLEALGASWDRPGEPLG